MKTRLSVLLGTTLLCLAVHAQTTEIQTVTETEKLDPKTSEQLQEFKNRLAAMHPELDVVKIEGDVMKSRFFVPYRRKGKETAA